MGQIKPKPIDQVIDRYGEYLVRLGKRRHPAPKNPPRKTPMSRIRFLDGDDILTHADALEFMDWAYSTLRGLGYTVTGYLNSFDIESSYYAYLQESVNNDGTKQYRLRDQTRAKLLALRIDLERKVTIHNTLYPAAPEPEPEPAPEPEPSCDERILAELKTLNAMIAELIRMWS